MAEVWGALAKVLESAHRDGGVDARFGQRLVAHHLPPGPQRVLQFHIRRHGGTLTNWFEQPAPDLATASAEGHATRRRRHLNSTPCGAPRLRGAHFPEPDAMAPNTPHDSAAPAPGTRCPPGTNTLWPDEPIAHDAPNRASGRDLVIGDLHGHFDTLEHALAALAFDPARDRLFSVGDLIDRGPRSADAVEWLNAGRFAGAVRGNHEQMMVDALVLQRGALRKDTESALWAANGGAWWWGFGDPKDERSRARERWLAALRAVPFVRTVDTATGRAGIVHTLDARPDWRGLCDAVRLLGERAHRREAPHGSVDRGNLPHWILWERPGIARERRDAGDLPGPMTGIDLVITGHTPARWPRWTRRNVLCIDTGVHIARCGHLTVAEIQSGVPRLHRFARVER